MMNHKVVFQNYGVRRPLKMRRRIARGAKKLWALFGSRRHERGHHSYWWTAGQDRLWLELRQAKGDKP